MKTINSQKGFTLIEMLIGAAIILILTGAVVGRFIDNRAATEARAYKAVQTYLDHNSIQTKRVSCSGDSDGDGNGTCNVVTQDGEKITLQCPVRFLDVNVFGATGCKEVFVNFNFMGGDK